MQPSDFGEKHPGRLLKMPQGYWAYVPAPLPPELDITWHLASIISEADRALSELAGLSTMLPNPHLLIDPFIRREAVLSSRIEGTQASLSDLFLFEASDAYSVSVADVREVANYVKALEYGLARIADLPVSTRLIREMHAELMKGVRGDHLTPGEFRRSQNWIGPPGCTLMDARFVPPPVLEMETALSDLEKYLHSPSPLPPLVRLAIVHYQFEAIHPFLDGNGRIGRLLLTLLLCTEGLLPQPLLYLSAYFERHRSAYYSGLLGVSQHGRWMEWILYFLQGVRDQSHDAVRRSRRLLDLQREYRQRLEAARATLPCWRLVDMLFSIPAMTTGQVATRLDTTHRTATLTINKLVELGVLIEGTGRQRNRIYVAHEIVNVIDERE